MPRRARRRFFMPVSTIEAPCHELYIGRHYAMTQLKDLANPTTAVDDKVKPTLVYRPSKNGRKTGLGAPWDNKDGVEKPLLPLYADRHKFSQLAGIADTRNEQERHLQKPTGLWFKLPPEIQDVILRDLLPWHRVIILFKGWTLLYRQSKPCLSPSILSTCRQVYQRGTRILYGENSFLYEVRDPANAKLHETELMKRDVYAGCVFPFDQHGGLLRNVRICIEPGYARLEHNKTAFMEALEKLLPRGGPFETEGKNLGSLTIEMPAVTELTAGLPPLELSQGSVPICSFFDKKSTVIQTIMKLKPDWLRLRVKVDSGGDVGGNWFFAIDVYLRGCFDEGDESRDGLEWQSIEAKEKYMARVKTSKATLDNISFRLYQLARDPYSTLSRSLWQRVQEDHHEELHMELNDVVSDETDWEDPSPSRQPVETPFADLRRQDEPRRQNNKTKLITSWMKDIHEGPADDEVVPEIDVLTAHNHRGLRFSSAEPPASHVVKGWVPYLDRSRDKPQKQKGRCPSPTREPDMTTFSGHFNELMRQKYLLADLRTDERPIKTSRGRNLRASNVMTSRKIRIKLRKFELRKLAMTWNE